MRTSNRKNNFTIKQITNKQRYYRYFTTGLGAFLLAYFSASILAPVQVSDAQEVTVENNATGYYITITASDTVNLSVDAVLDGALATASQTVNVKTNSLSGYQLLLSADITNNLYKDGDANNASLGYFHPISDSVSSASVSSPSALALDTWGFALDSSTDNSYAKNFADKTYYDTSSPNKSATFAPVPVNSAGPQVIQQTDTKTSSSGNDIDVYYGVNATTRVPSGSYSTTVTYTAFSDATSPVTDTMQNFTAEQCSNIAEDTYIVLKDSRDNKDYLVSRLKDGNCWMIQNLALDPGITLSPSDSNVTTQRELPASASIDGNGTTPSEYDTPQVITTFQDTQDSYGSFYGNYYNWNAATATVGKQATATTTTIYESICPKGWRLPDSGTWSATDATGVKIKSYANLVGAYDLPSASNPGENKTNADAVTKIQQAPLYFPLTGLYNSQIDRQGGTGYYFSRTKSNHNSGLYTYGLFFNNDSGNFTPNNNVFASSWALPVRCVFGENSANYMQNFTTTMCNSLTQATNGETADVRRALMDSRDGKLYNVSRLADGNCWMVSNLALDGGRTLTKDDSNVTEDRTLPENIAIGEQTAYDAAQIYSGEVNTVDSYGSSYGNYYNWNAATATLGKYATSTTVYESICPKGWRLPDDTTAAGTKSFPNLMGKYTVNIDGTGDNLPTGNTNSVKDAVARVQETPLFFPLAGRWYYTRTYVESKGSVAAYWSRQQVTNAAPSTRGMFLNVSDGFFGVQGTENKSNLYTVRCVFGE